MAGQKGYSVESALKKIDRCLLYANGIFIKSSVTDDRRGKESLNQFMRKNPGCFRTILTEGTSLIQVTQIYSSLRNIEKIIPHIESAGEMIKSVIWGAFIIQNRMEKNLSSQEILFMNGPAVLDDLVSDYSGYHGLIITAPFRVSGLKSPHYIPSALSSRWSERIIESLWHKSINGGSKDISDDGDLPILSENLVDGGIWPEDEFECHTDRRKYPAIDGELTGVEKWKYDQFILTDGDKMPEGYQLGVYQL